MKTLSMSGLHEIMKNLPKDELILDVRTVGEFSEGHVPGAANIPVDEVMTRVEELKKYKAIYIYCRAGRRAETAMDILHSMGIKNLRCVSEGGFPNWEAAGHAVSSLKP